MENSGVGMCWVESDMYRPVTVKPIINGKHVKRGVTAHMITLQALFGMYFEAFVQHNPESRDSVHWLVDELDAFVLVVPGRCNRGTHQINIKYGISGDDGEDAGV